MEHISLIKIILIFYLLIANNFTTNLFSKQLKTFFTENRMAQHLIGFITMIVIITLTTTNINICNILVYSIIGYIWFIFSTKLDIQWSIIIILLILFGYLYELKINEKQKQIEQDPIMTNDKKQELIQQNNKYKKYIIVFILMATLAGTTLYANKKMNQYGGGQFDLVTYLFN